MAIPPVHTKVTIRNSRRLMGRMVASSLLGAQCLSWTRPTGSARLCLHVRQRLIPTVGRVPLLSGVRYENTATQPGGGPFPAGSGRPDVNGPAVDGGGAGCHAAGLFVRGVQRPRP